MRALLLYIAAGTIAVTGAINLAQGSAQGLAERIEQRNEQICAVAPHHCS